MRTSSVRWIFLITSGGILLPCVYAPETVFASSISSSSRILSWLPPLLGRAPKFSSLFLVSRTLSISNLRRALLMSDLSLDNSISTYPLRLPLALLGVREVLWGSLFVDQARFRTLSSRGWRSGMQAAMMMMLPSMLLKKSASRVISSIGLTARHCSHLHHPDS
jgi:hypothetical protein